VEAQKEYEMTDIATDFNEDESADKFEKNFKKWASQNSEKAEKPKNIMIKEK
jgi:hypothetical protein